MTHASLPVPPQLRPSLFQARLWCKRLLIGIGLAGLLSCDDARRAAGQDANPSKGKEEKGKDQSTIDPELLRRDGAARLQYEAMEKSFAPWGHWGNRPSGYNAWTNHSNRLIPVYAFGGSLHPFQGENSLYRSREKIEAIYGQLPDETLNPNAEYLDQTDLFQMQKRAIEGGKKYLFLIVFDGMDWQTTWAAATYAAGSVRYREGRGTGLAFQDYRGTSTEFGYMVTSPYSDDCDVDPDAQQIKTPWKLRGGYAPRLGGQFPWDTPADPDYLIGRSKSQPHAYTDSSSSATSMTAGIKTFNGSINVTHDLRQVETIAHWAQAQRQMKVGVVSSVPISHATPASAYAHNVSRDDYQDLSRDLLGLPSIAHRQNPLPGMDVVLGAGWGATTDRDPGQGANFEPGNKYLADSDLQRVSLEQGGKYRVVQRTAGEPAVPLLEDAVRRSIDEDSRLLGYFGTSFGHLPFQTANGDYQPVRDVKEKTEKYTPADLAENPTLADMTRSAIQRMENSPQGFWLLIEPGDVDWANHSNNLDNSIGAVLSGDAAFQAVVSWIEAKEAWDQSLVIVTADHGHYLNLVQPEAIAEARQLASH
jgi:alkaline phosphatase